MKKYSFKLESVLKMRRMAEERSRQDLGRLMVIKNNMLNQIEREKNEIDEIFNQQEKSLAESFKPSVLAFYSESIQAKKMIIESLRQQIVEQDQKIELQRQDLILKKAELKMIEKLDEKDFEKYKKAYEKEQNQKIEEQVQLWKEYQKDWA